MRKNSLLIETPDSWRDYALQPGDDLSDLRWSVKARLIYDFHQHHVRLFGRPNGMRLQDGWSKSSTAAILKISKGLVVFYCQLGAALEKDPDIASIDRMTAALKYIHANGLLVDQEIVDGLDNEDS